MQYIINTYFIVILDTRVCVLMGMMGFFMNVVEGTSGESQENTSLEYSKHFAPLHRIDNSRFS